ncbi:MAG TPA: hypothetical protein VHU91_09830 [Mycobacteriales bacterium]|nr:hypothetical protein [Mycobacteriales bacterium]
MVSSSSGAGYHLVEVTHNLAAGNGRDNPNNFGDTMSSGVAGPIAGIVILLLGIATVLLIRNMNKRLRRLPSQFENEAKPADLAAAAPASKSDDTRKSS